jgi:hypothetical protein
MALRWIVSNSEEIEAAEVKMNPAKDVLLSYIETHAAIERERYRRLASRLKKAEADFLKAISELGE